MALGVALLCLLIHCELAESAIYTVGGTGGWTFNTVTWPNGKRFRAGDVLGKCMHALFLLVPYFFSFSRESNGWLSLDGYSF